ncbi:MAG: hypothetical protein K0R67_2202, partial [Paenibacillus sp.]|nr:hypothetical protein [Paenibacillus sp.]
MWYINKVAVRKVLAGRQQDCSLKTEQRTCKFEDSRIFNKARLVIEQVKFHLYGEFDPGSGRTLAACL